MSTNALLIKLSISQWYNQRADKKISDEVADKYEVTEREDKYIKTLLPRTALRTIHRAITEIRAFHYANTLPWQDDSVRILSAANFMHYQQGLAARRDALESAISLFIADYPKWIEHARKTKKGLFDASQYPSAEGFRDSFKVSTLILPFPDTADFRVDIEGPELAKLKAESQAAISGALATATKHLNDRLYERVYLLYSALNTPDKIFHDRTLTSVFETADLVEKLNISNDENLSYAVQTLRTLLNGVAPDGLRTAPEFRNNLAKSLEEFLHALR